MRCVDQKSDEVVEKPSEMQLPPIAKQPLVMLMPFAIVVEPVFEMLKRVEVAQLLVEDAIVKRLSACAVVVGDAPIAKSADGEVVPMPIEPFEVIVVVAVAPNDAEFAVRPPLKFKRVLVALFGKR